MTKKHKTLDECIGKYWMYKTNTYLFQSYQEENDKITIATDGRWLVVKRSQLKTFLEELLPAEGPAKPAKNGSESSKMDLQVLRENSQSVISLMKENIEELKKNPEYVKQAREINKSAGRMIEVAKLEFQVRKEMNKQ